MMPAVTDSVLVVGAGPVGLAAACELAHRGVPVRIIDKLEQPTTQSRAVVVHARSLEALARMGVADEVIATGQRTVGMEMHAGEESVGRFRLDTISGPYRFSVTLPQDETERILGARLRQLGVSVERTRELASLEQDEHHVRATLADGTTSEHRWVLGADGAHSTVRHQVGMKLEGTFKGEHFLMGDVDAEHGLEPTFMHTFFGQETGPLMVFPMVGARVRLIAQADGEVEASLELLQRVVNERTPGFELTNPRWVTSFEIRHAQVPRYRAGRVFLAGDAAHVHSPAGGQGMNTGIQDAFNLAWKLAEPDPSEALLDSYHAERHPIAARVIEVTTQMTRLATIHSPLVRRLRNRALRIASGIAPIAHQLAAETEEQHVAYRDSPIVAGRRFGHGPRPGEIAPLGDGVTEISTANDPEDAYGFGAAGGIAVVRPDGYIGLLTRDRADVDAYFGKLRTPCPRAARPSRASI
jgi:2-polyprenyl-6-methoxyphenol hydroxylase-like FAD-dependent oxidoreductase